MRKRALVLLPFVLLLSFGAMLFLLALKGHYAHDALQNGYQKTIELDLHFLTLIQTLKSQIQNHQIPKHSISKFSLTIQKDYLYQVIIIPLAQDDSNHTLYQIDALGSITIKNQKLSHSFSFLLPQ